MPSSLPTRDGIASTARRHTFAALWSTVRQLKADPIASHDLTGASAVRVIPTTGLLRRSRGCLLADGESVARRLLPLGIAAAVAALIVGLVATNGRGGAPVSTVDGPPSTSLTDSSSIPDSTVVQPTPTPASSVPVSPPPSEPIATTVPGGRELATYQYDTAYAPTYLPEGLFIAEAHVEPSLDVESWKRPITQRWATREGVEADRRDVDFGAVVTVRSWLLDNDIPTTPNFPRCQGLHPAVVDRRMEDRWSAIRRHSRRPCRG
jgi:hypothetical protein